MKKHILYKNKQSRKKASGLAIVEFTIISSAMLIIFFGLFEIGRYVYSIQMLNEATRRAARLATVCYIDSSATIIGTDNNKIDGKSTISSLDAISSIIPSGFSASNFKIEYLNDSMQSATNFDDIDFVRASVDTENSSYTFVNVLTSLNASSLIPKFETTLPAESLGVHRYGVSGTPGDSDYDNCN